VITVPVRDPQMSGRRCEIESLWIVVAKPPASGKRGALEPRVEEHADRTYLHQERGVVEIVNPNRRHEALGQPAIPRFPL